VSQASADLPIGSAIPDNKKIAHNPYNESNRGSEQNIHDDAVAQRLGFQRGFVAGGQSIGMISESLLAFFGPEYFRSGQFQATYVAPVFEEDAITIKGTVKEKVPEGDRTRLVCDVWMEKADGTKAVVGTASALV
jgi:hypothetical protein